jgi:glyoxylase-like metal-dependent hydrolase (beta-lactamase superfamily II)
VAQRADGALRAEPIGDGLTLIAGAGGNVVVLAVANELLLVNGGSPEKSSDLLAFVAERFGGARISTLFNTDWHPDHTGSNVALGSTGTTIVAHEHTKQYLAARLTVDWQERTYYPQPKPALPTRTFYNGGSVTFGGDTIEYGPLGQAHTDGDIYVLFKKQNVLVAGDVVSAGTYPIADYTTGGWLGGLVAGTTTLLALANAETRVVAGTGAVQTKTHLQAEHDMLAAVRERMVKMMRSGMGPDDMLAAGITKEYDATWGDPALFVETSYRGLWLHVRELGGIV